MSDAMDVICNHMTYSLKPEEVVQLFRGQLFRNSLRIRRMLRATCKWMRKLVHQFLMKPFSFGNLFKGALTPDELFLNYADDSFTVYVYEEDHMRLVKTETDGTKTERWEKLTPKFHRFDLGILFDKCSCWFEAEKKKLLIQFPCGEFSLMMGAERWAQLAYVDAGKYHTASVRIGENTAALFPNDKCTVHI